MASDRAPLFITFGAAAFAALLSVALFAGSIVAFRRDEKGEGCQFNVNRGLMPTREPLFLLPDGSLDLNGYLLPDNNGDVVLATDDKVLVACPGKKVVNFTEEVLASCVTDTIFNVNGKNVNISALECSAQPTHTAAYTGATCGAGGRGQLAQIGHKTSRGLVVLIEVCFYEKTLEALYASSIVSGRIGGRRSGVDRPAFVPGTFYGSVDPNSHYVRGGQQSGFASILGSQNKPEGNNPEYHSGNGISLSDDQELAYEYIANSTDYYLARGHMVAKADFAWAQPQRATFYYINAAPQWQTFNGANWERLESSVRALAAARQSDLLVVTGAWDRARLPDAKGLLQDLFINADGLIPVPALYWKVVYNNATLQGVAFVGVNNPYTTLKSEPRLKLCDDVCSSIGWVSWAPTSIVAGEGYCCEVDALRAKVPDVPQLKVVSLLT